MRTFSPNSPFLYMLAGLVIVYVLAQSVFFMTKAFKQAKALNIKPEVLKRTVFSSALFSVIPALSFLVGVLSLSAFLGLPVPWIRLSVLGAITYELPAAHSTARALGIATDTLITSAKDFSAIFWVMTVGILSGLLVILFGLKKMQSGVLRIKAKDQKWGEILISALFMGMISAFVGVLFADVHKGLAGWLPVAVALVSAALMALLGLLIKKCNVKWLEQYALPLAMLGGMAAAIPLSRIMQ